MKSGTAERRATNHTIHFSFYLVNVKLKVSWSKIISRTCHLTRSASIYAVINQYYKDLYLPTTNKAITPSHKFSVSLSWFGTCQRIANSRKFYKPDRQWRTLMIFQYICGYHWVLWHGTNQKKMCRKKNVVINSYNMMIDFQYLHNLL